MRIGHMFEYVDVSGLNAGEALGVLERAQQAKRHAEVQEAMALLRVVRTYRHQIPTDKVTVAGEGTGLIDVFACVELAAALHRGLESVTAQVIELLNLEARLPRLWEITVACGVPLWLGRRIARATGELSLERSRWVDATLAPFVTRLGPSRLIRFAEALVVQADPAAAEARWARQNRPKVQIGAMHRDGLRDIYGWLNAADATFLDAALNQLSGILAGQGSTEDASQRRATALGILATPARALALIQQSLQQPRLPEDEPAQPNAVDALPPLASADVDLVPDLGEAPDAGLGSRDPHCSAGHTCGSVTVAPDRLLPRTTLVVHLSDDTLVTGNGLGRCERLGPVTVDQIRRLLADSRVTVQPVFNPNGIIAVDAYEIPARMRRAVLQRHPYEVFPFATMASAGLDLDHTRPYRPGLSGQTDLDNLGPLRRKSHRAKTHAGWRVRQPEPGRFVWTSPLGRRYVVNPSGLSTDYRHPPGANPWDNPLGGALLPDPPTQRPSASRAARSSRARPVLRR